MDGRERNTYFADLSKLPAREEVLDELWARNMIAVPLPETGREGTVRTDHQKKRQRWAAKYFHALAENGGYAWVRAPRGNDVKAGRVRPVEPGTGPEDFEAVDEDQYVLRLGDEAGPATRLKTLRLEDVVEVGANEAMGLRAMESMVGYFDEWYEASPRLAALVEGRPVERRWANLRPEMRLSVCAEFLRHHRDPSYPRLVHLLLPVADRDPGRYDSRLYYADIYGLAEDGEEVLAQVPLADDNMKYNMRMERKVEALHGYARPGRRLICFWDFDSALLGYTRHQDPEPFSYKGVQFITVEEVLSWVKGWPSYAERVFSA